MGGARAYAEETARRLRDEALDALRGVPLSDKALADLGTLAAFMMEAVV